MDAAPHLNPPACCRHISRVARKKFAGRIPGKALSLWYGAGLGIAVHIADACTHPAPQAALGINPACHFAARVAERGKCVPILLVSSRNGRTQSSARGRKSIGAAFQHGHPREGRKGTKGVARNCTKMKDPNPSPRTPSVKLQTDFLDDGRERRDVRAQFLVMFLRRTRRDLERHAGEPLAHVGHGEYAADLLA